MLCGGHLIREQARSTGLAITGGRLRFVQVYRPHECWNVQPLPLYNLRQSAVDRRSLPSQAIGIWTASRRLSFVGTKNASVSEVQRFLVLHRQSRSPTVAPKLKSSSNRYNSGIPLRDERMREELFQIEQFPRSHHHYPDRPASDRRSGPRRAAWSCALPL